jgi:hypothetical protein
MTFMRGTMVMSVAALSLGVLSRGAAAQSGDGASVASKIFDASVSRERQIALAMSAAPAEVSSKATIYVLGPNGYEKARQGTNGFSCLVHRMFVNPTETTMGPMCLDAEGSRTTLVTYLHGEDLRSHGKSEAEIKADLASGLKDGRFQNPGKTGVLYMLSTENRVGPTADHKSQHFPPHLMFYAPNMTDKDLGFDSTPQLSFMGMTDPGAPDNLIVVLPVQADSHKH